LSYNFIISVSGNTYTSINTQTNVATTSSNVAQLITNNLFTGGITYVEAGNYVITQTIIPHSNSHLILSPNAVISQASPSSLSQSITLLGSNTPITGFTVDGGRWNGNKGSLTDHRGSSTWNTCFGGYMGLYFTGSSNIVVKNAIIENIINSGVYTSKVTNALVSNVTVNNGGDNPITFNGNLDGGANGNWSNTAENCTVNGGIDVGINTFHADNCTIKYCIVTNILQGTSMGGSNWGIAAENSKNVNIIGNTVSQCSENIVSTSDAVKIDGNTVDASNNKGADCAIHIISGDGNIVKNNVIKNSAYPLVTAWGGRPTNTEFINNTVTDNTSDARCVFGGDVGTIVLGGSIQTNNADGCISLRGSSKITIDNVIFIGTKGVLDYGQTSTYIDVKNCIFKDTVGNTIAGIIDLSHSIKV